MSSKMFTVLSVLIVIAACIWSANTAEGQVAIESGLVSFWTFDAGDINGGTAKDVFGNNDGTMEGNLKEVPGIINEALEFDGVDSFVDCGGDASLNLTDALTIELWIYPNAAGEGGNNAGPACRAVAGGLWNWQLRYNAPGSFMGFQFNAVPEGSTWISVQENLEPEEWHHITGTFDGTDIICYLNGEEKDTASISGITDSEDTFFIGQDGWVNVFDGAVDEVRIYDRALTEAEVKNNFNSRLQLAVKPANRLTLTWGGIKK